MNWPLDVQKDSLNNSSNNGNSVWLSWWEQEFVEFCLCKLDIEIFDDSSSESSDENDEDFILEETDSSDDFFLA